MSRSHSKKVHVGISGWRYTPWRGNFYPENLTQRRELEFASHQVNSIEINGTFYALQKPASFRSWYSQTPDGFIFSVKAPRYITHVLRLSKVELPMANFFASGVLCLQEKLGPILWQLPPTYKYDPDALEPFLQALPTDTATARKLARKHESFISKTDYGDLDAPLRHALEVRHHSFECAQFIEQLRKHKVALVIADTAGRWPLMEDITADFLYLRLHGDAELYTSGYTDNALQNWSKKIKSWMSGRSPQGTRLVAPGKKQRIAAPEIFVYFDNDVKVHAPYDAMKLAHALKIASPPQQRPPEKLASVRQPSDHLSQRWF